MKKLVAFDLDGTLVDTAPDLIATLNVLFARKGLPRVADGTLRIMIGGGALTLRPASWRISKISSVNAF